jgi:hypothetical protein
MACEVGRGDFLFAALLQILVEAWPSVLDFLFRLVAIEQVDARRDGGIAIGMCVDDISRYVTRAGKYRFQELPWNIPFVNLLGIQDKKTVGAGRKSALDCEEIGIPQGIFDFSGATIAGITGGGGIGSVTRTSLC